MYITLILNLAIKTDMSRTQSDIRNNVKVGFQEPKQYHVVFHNDDFTTMEFVVSVLKIVFRKSQADAEAIMMKVHKEGKAIAGTYSFDIAVSKANKATRMAREKNYPLKLTVEEA